MKERIVWWSIDRIKPYEQNPRKITDKAIEVVAESIKSFGFKNPILVDKDGVIIAGHTRRLAAQKLGIESVPVVVCDDLTEQQVKALRLADNKTSEFSKWEPAILEAELLDVSDIDMQAFGFEPPELPAEVLEDEFDENSDQVETKCKFGDLWALGEHRLMCGNSTDKASVERLMGGGRVDMVFTDPPYGISIVKKNGKIGGGNLAKNRTYSKVIADETTDTAEAAYNLLSKLCERIVLWGGNYFTKFLPFSDGWIIWDKRLDIASNNFADGEMAWCSFHTPVRIYHQLWNGMIREGEHEDRVHPTQKPIKMLGEILRDFSEENETVLDVFGGSGSTLIACEQLNRKCFMMELDPHYCDVIIARWEKLTGKKAVKVA